MLYYKISSHNPVSHYLEIELQIKLKGTRPFDLVLPAWRPGRYEGADYVKNIRDFKIEDEEGNNIRYQKTSKNVWHVQPQSSSYKISYSYFAFQADAGASYIDDEFWIVNPLNCLMYPNGFQSERCFVEVNLPEKWEVATTLTTSGNIYRAGNYYELTDKPLIAARELAHLSYNIQNIPFHLYVYGKAPVDLKDLIPSFEAFSKAQLDMFSSCPFDKYFFFIIILPFRFYHGVEHADNTVLVLGIDEGGGPQAFTDDLLGVSSHELFHTWNIKKIRPKELLPYNLRDFTIFNTGMIAEGVTTYYGDLFLVRSHVWSISRYLQEVNLFLKKHYRNPGRYYASLTASSENLWIDGYKPGAPFHKVSIYVKGAIVAMMLDLKIRLHSKHQYSLDDIMRYLDEEIAGTGYGLTDIQQKAEGLTQVNFQEFFENYAYGTTPVDAELNDLCSHFGLTITKQMSENPLERYYGIISSLKEGHLVIETIDRNSPAEKSLSVGDKIIMINDEKPADFSNEKIKNAGNIQLRVKRLGRILEITLNRTEEKFFSFYQLKLSEQINPEQRQSLKKWLFQ